MFIRSTLLGAVVVLTAASAWTQNAGFEHHGNFRHMSRTGQTEGQVQLSALDTAPGRWGVGALAGLKGEIVQVDGKLLVSRGSDPLGRVQAPAPQEAAALWASDRVAQWVPTQVPEDFNQSRFEAFVLTQAKARGLDGEQPFVFRVTGDYAHLIWHVVTGEKPVGAGSGRGGNGGHGGHGAGHAQQGSDMKLFHSREASGQLVGVYSGHQLEGIVSHPGERFHLHYIDQHLTVSGHVDQYSVRAGATLWLPKH
jgi:hypothetical protein